MGLGFMGWGAVGTPMHSPKWHTAPAATSSNRQGLGVVMACAGAATWQHAALAKVVHGNKECRRTSPP